MVEPKNGTFNCLQINAFQPLAPPCQRKYSTFP